MDNTLRAGYQKLYDREVDEHEFQNWELAVYIAKAWDVGKLGEDLAKECIFRIINHTTFHNPEFQKQIVGMMEEKATELFDMGEHDPHMAYIAELEREYYEMKNRKKEHEPVEPKEKIGPVFKWKVK